MRPSGRKNDQLREISFDIGYAPQADGSCFVKCGNTHILCTATLEERVPPFLKGKGEGWLTAEYGMLPCSTDRRMDREAARGKQSGRTQEIQRLIGRSLRAALDFKSMGEKQIIVDCDVIRADGGTRTAAITGGFLALYQAAVKGAQAGILNSMPIINQVAAISCGLYKGEAVADLDYLEDSDADADANFVMTSKGEIIEIQGTAEKAPFSHGQFTDIMQLAQNGISELCAKQADIMKQIF
ncbi:MAG: ribonuclease PH [Pseudomonadota bacterium]